MKRPIRTLITSERKTFYSALLTDMDNILIVNNCDCHYECPIQEFLFNSNKHKTEIDEKIQT